MYDSGCLESEQIDRPEMSLFQTMPIPLCHLSTAQFLPTSQTEMHGNRKKGSVPLVCKVPFHIYYLYFFFITTLLRQKPLYDENFVEMLFSMYFLFITYMNI